MTTSYTLLTKTRVDRFNDIASIGDVKAYELDCSPWADDNGDITSATWTVEYGQASISDEALASNVLSANISFSESGTQLITILFETASGLKKKIWLNIVVKDERYPAGDYDG